MGKLTCATMVVCLFVSASVLAAELPKAEVFGGYSLSRMPSSWTNNLNGWNASVSGNLSGWFGLAGDFSGYYASPEVRILSLNIPIGPEQSKHMYLLGPRFTYRGFGRIVPFTHVLVGRVHSSSGLFGFDYSNSSAFAAAVGGGLDIPLGKTIAIRAIQADYLMTRFDQGGQNNARVSAGIVFRFGN